MAQPASLTSWRSRPTAVLPLAFLQAFAYGFIELPVFYLLRELECERYAATLPHVPEVDLCREPPVQKAYSADVAIYLAICTIFAIVVSGPYGKMSDMKGRRIVMSSVAGLNAIGDAWLCLCAVLPPIRKPQSLLFAALIKGLGGSFSVAQSTQSAFVADTSASGVRSFYLGLVLVMFWTASAVAPLGVSFLLLKDRYAACFGTAAAGWTSYFLYAKFVLKEVRVPSEQLKEPENQENQENKNAFLRSFVEPLIFIFCDPTLRWLGIVTLTYLVAIGIFSVLVVYCDFMFGTRASEAGIIVAIMSIARASSVVIVLPVFLALYRRFHMDTKLNHEVSPSEAPTAETSPLLSSPDTDFLEDTISSAKVADQIASAAQELLITRVCFLIDAVGMILILLSRNILEVTIATAIGAMGAPAYPSLQALITLAAPPSQVGRILAGFSMLESTGVAMRNPLLFGMYGATLEIAPRTVWYFAALLFVFCAICVMCLRPARFIRKPDDEQTRTQQ